MVCGGYFLVWFCVMCRCTSRAPRRQKGARDATMPGGKESARERLKIEFKSPMNTRYPLNIQ